MSRMPRGVQRKYSDAERSAASAVLRASAKPGGKTPGGVTRAKAARVNLAAMNTMAELFSTLLTQLDAIHKLPPKYQGTLLRTSDVLYRSKRPSVDEASDQGDTPPSAPLGAGGVEGEDASKPRTYPMSTVENSPKSVIEHTSGDLNRVLDGLEGLENADVETRLLMCFRGMRGFMRHYVEENQADRAYQVMYMLTREMKDMYMASAKHLTEYVVREDERARLEAEVSQMSDDELKEGGEGEE